MSGLVKIHAIKAASKHPAMQLSYTWCGMSGTQERSVTNEYTTLDGRDARFEVTMHGETPTCKRCAKAMEKAR